MPDGFDAAIQPSAQPIVATANGGIRAACLGLNTGAGNLIRTDDILFTRQALFHLSYTGIELAPQRRIELLASRSTGECSSTELLRQYLLRLLSPPV